MQVHWQKATRGSIFIGSSAKPTNQKTAKSTSDIRTEHIFERCAERGSQKECAVIHRAIAIIFNFFLPS
jgi:hypothetical protein